MVHIIYNSYVQTGFFYKKDKKITTPSLFHKSPAVLSTENKYLQLYPSTLYKLCNIKRVWLNKNLREPVIVLD